MAGRRRAAADLLVAGEAFEDLVFHGLPRLPHMGEELRTAVFSRTLGGGTLITALVAARAGARVEVLSVLPDAAVMRLGAEGVGARNLKKPGEAHAVTVALSTRADRAFVTFDGANRRLERRLLDLFARRLPRARHLHLALGPTHLSAWTRLLRRCRARGITTSWDFGWHEPLPRRAGFRELVASLDWVFVNEREAVHYARVATLAQAVTQWREMAPRSVIKLGRRGAMLLAGGGTVRQAARRVRVVDTTGAGDGFNGAFLAALLSGAEAGTCLHAGVAAGTRATLRVGGLP